MSTDENKNSGNNTNTAQDINPVIRKTVSSLTAGTLQ